MSQFLVNMYLSGNFLLGYHKQIISGLSCIICLLFMYESSGSALNLNKSSGLDLLPYNHFKDNLWFFEQFSKFGWTYFNSVCFLILAKDAFKQYKLLFQYSGHYTRI